MEYTVQKLARIAGVSTRTLRYYDEFGLLKPARINSSGYRIYGPREVDRLQQILFYRELGMGLTDIREIITAPSFDSRASLLYHRDELLKKRDQLDALIQTVEKAIAYEEGRIHMTDAEKFEAFKDNMLRENEEKYGAEVRAKYGEDVVNESYQKVKNWTPEQHARAEQLGAEYMQMLDRAMDTGDPGGELAQKACDLHRQWLSLYWPSYTKEAHAGVAQMYVDDERFTAHYDQKRPGTAKFLRDAVMIYTGQAAE